MELVTKPYRVMKEEEWICEGGRASDQYKHTAKTETIRTIGRPLLSADAIGGLQSVWTRPRHITSENNMGSGVGSEEVLEIRLEASIVPVEVVKRYVHGVLRVRGVDHERGVHSGRWGEAIRRGEERLKSVVTANVVRYGVGKHNVLQSTGGDLVIIVGVTPRSQTIMSGIGKDRRVLGVLGICLRVRTRIQILFCLRRT